MLQKGVPLSADNTRSKANKQEFQFYRNFIIHVHAS
jgi:hypothetical protein